MKNYYRLFSFLISIFLPLNTHQTFFQSSKRQNFYALNKPIMLPPRQTPMPQPIYLSNQVQGTPSQMPLNPKLLSKNGQSIPQHLNGQPLPQHLQNGQLLPKHLQNGQPLPQNGQPLPHHLQNGQPLPQHLQNGQQLPQHLQNGQQLTQHFQNGQPLPQNGHPLPQSNQPLPHHLQNGQPLPQNGHPLPQSSQNGQPLPQSSQNGQPLPQHPQSGQPLSQHPQNGHPMPQNGHPMPQNGHPMPQNGHPMLQNGHPLPQNGHPMLQNGYPIPQNGHPLPLKGNTLPQPMSPNQIPQNGQHLHQLPQKGHPLQPYHIHPNGQPFQHHPPQNVQSAPPQHLPTAQPQTMHTPPQPFPQTQQPQPQMLQHPSPSKFGKQGQMHHLHPPNKGPIPMASAPKPQMLMAPPTNTIHGQKIGTTGPHQGMMMLSPPGMTQGPQMGQWAGMGRIVVYPNMVIPPEMDVRDVQTLEPVVTTSQPILLPVATTNTPENTSLIPVLPVDNATDSLVVVTEDVQGFISNETQTEIRATEDVDVSNETNLIFSHDDNFSVDDHWRPIMGDKLDGGPVHFVMGPTNSTSEEQIEPLPDNQSLVGPHPHLMPGPYGGRGDLEKQPSKLESIKRGIYGILFGRKGPPEVVNEFRRKPPPRLPNNNINPSHPDSRWHPMANKLQMMANRRQQDKITCTLFTSDVCLEVNDYPFDIIMNELMRNTKRVNAMYADVPSQDRLELMDGVSSKIELSHGSKHYFGNDNSHSHRDYGQEGGNVCPSEVLYSKPRRGRNIKGEWKYVINVPQFPQTIRLERCLKPKSRCSYVDPSVQSQCSQLHTLQRTLVWNIERGLHIDVLMFPSACSCYLLPTHNPLTNNSNGIPHNWEEDSMLMDETINSDTISGKDDHTGTRRRKFTTPNLLGPYTRTLHKYTRDDLVDNDQRRHTNFGRPLVAEKSYLDENQKVNYNQHSTSDYIKPWN